MNIFDPIKNSEAISKLIFVRHLTPKSNKVYRCDDTFTVYQDDAIRVIKEKLAVYRLHSEVHHSHLYMWYEDPETGSMQPMGTRFDTSDGARYTGPCDPFDDVFGTEGNVIVNYSDEGERTLFEFDVSVGTVHVATYDDVATHIGATKGNQSVLRHCFPEYTKHFDNTKAERRLKIDEHIMKTYVDRSIASTTHAFETTATVKSAAMGDIAIWNLGYEIHHLFEYLSTDERWPFIRLSTAQQSLYKLHTPALQKDNEYHISDVQLRRWTVANTMTKQPYIEIMVSYMPYIFASLKVYQSHNPKRIIAALRLNAYNNGSLQFDSNIFDEKDGPFTKHVRAIVAEMAEVIGPPDSVDTKNYDLSKMRTTLNIHSKSVVPDMEVFADLISQLHPLVSLVPSNIPNTMTMIYKRVPNMRSSVNVSHIVSMFTKNKDWLTLPKKDIIEQVFGYDEDETSRALNDSKQHNSLYARNNKFAPPEIRIAENALGELSFEIQGVHGNRTHRSIVTLLRYLVFYSEKKKKQDLPKSQSPKQHSPSFSPMFDIDSPFDDRDFEIGSTSKFSFQKYALKSLQRADPALFDTSYSRTCQKSANRQPIVVNKQELEKIDRMYPGSYFNNYIGDYGTDASARKRNIYICPEIWCPLSRVSMTTKQLEESDGKCPNPNEKVMHIDNKYFRKGESGKPRFASFAKKSGKCYPCCFAPTSVETARAKHAKTTKECDAATSSQDGTDDSDRYIKGQQFPLETGRYGVLPSAVSSNLPDMSYPSGPGGTGNISKSTDCLVRVGVGDGDLVKAIEWLMKSKIVNDIVSNMTMEIFMMLNRGRTMRMLIKDANLTPRAKKEFDAWLTGTKLGKQFADSFAFAREDTNETEFVMWSAMEYYKRFVADGDYRKTEEDILDVCNHKAIFQGTHPPIFIVVEVDDKGRFLVTKDAYGDLMPAEMRGREYSVIIKQGGDSFDNYEPICRVFNATKGDMKIMHRFKIGDYAPVDAIIETYLENMSGRFDPMCCTKDVLYQVLDYNFRVVGVVSKAKKYRTITCCEPLIGRPNRPLFIFIDQADRFLTDDPNPKADFVERARDERNIFVRKALADPRTRYYAAKQDEGAMMSIARDVIARRSPTVNNASLSFFKEKQMITEEIKAQLIRTKKIPNDKVDAIVDKLAMEILLNDRLPQITHNIRKKMMCKFRKGGKSEIVFDQSKVDSGKLWQSIVILNNPYVCCPNPTGDTKTID
jgi:hypothetical protein